MEDLQIICGLFYEENGYKNALKEFRWSIKQNRNFWKKSILFLDPRCESTISGLDLPFREVVVDSRMPQVVKDSPKWNCKGWWAYKGAEKYKKILFCDFDIFVRKHPDDFLCSYLNSSPKFLLMNDYNHPEKVVGCGCAYYENTCDWEKYLPAIFNKWKCDERAWTDVLKLKKNDFFNSSYHMNPYIVNWDWLILNKNTPLINEAYIIHGISNAGWGRSILRSIGYTEAEINFESTLFESVRYHIHLLRNKIIGKSKYCKW